MEFYDDKIYCHVMKEYLLFKHNADYFESKKYYQIYALHYDVRIVLDKDSYLPDHSKLKFFKELIDAKKKKIELKMQAEEKTKVESFKKKIQFQDIKGALKFYSVVIIVVVLLIYSWDIVDWIYYQLFPATRFEWVISPENILIAILIWFAILILIMIGVLWRMGILGYFWRKHFPY